MFEFFTFNIQRLDLSKHTIHFRSNRPEVCNFIRHLLCVKVSNYGVIFGPNTGKHRQKITPYLDTFHAVLGPRAISFKKENLAQVLSCEFCKITQNTFFTEHVWDTASVISLIPIFSIAP